MRERAAASGASGAQRFLGLELSGAKNHKTSLSILEFYPKEQKIFLLDIHDRIASRELQEGTQTPDEALLELLSEVSPGLALMGVNVPLSLPPCFTCQSSRCGTSCRSKSTQWMDRFAKKHAGKRREILFTPYTQRPVELWLRHEVLSEVHRSIQFEIDEALGGNRAPLTARMQFLGRRLDRSKLIEVLPKLTALRLCLSLGLDRRVLTRYRKLEEGSHARMQFLEALVEKRGVFIYERDMKKLSHSLPAFDSFLCAYTALLAEQRLCEKPPRGFPVDSGWVHFPVLAHSR